MLAPMILEDTKIIYVEGFDVGEGILARMLNEFAEAVAKHRAVVINCYENRSQRVCYDVVKLLVGVFGCAGFEDIGSAKVVNIKDLMKKG